MFDRKMGLAKIDRLGKSAADGVGNLTPEMVEIEGRQKNADDRDSADNQNKDDRYDKTA